LNIDIVFVQQNGRSNYSMLAFRLFGGGMSEISNVFPRPKSPTHLKSGGEKEGHLKQCLFRRPAAIPAGQTTARLSITFGLTNKYSEIFGLFHGVLCPFPGWCTILISSLVSTNGSSLFFANLYFVFQFRDSDYDRGQVRVIFLRTELFHY
jgi:hypothetical protein